MNKNQRSTLGIGILLILAGVYFALVNIVPGLRGLIGINFSWPIIIMLVGAGLLILGFILGAPDMAVPAFIVAGVGGILYYQNLTGNWGAWSYMWALIPGFVGLGMLTAWLLGARERYTLKSAFDSIGTSLVLFIIFGAFFGAFKELGPYWPLLLVAAGVLIALRTLIRPQQKLDK